MAVGRVTGRDPLAVLAVVIVMAVSVGYIWLIRQEGDQPEVWFLAGLAGSGLLVAYGSSRTVRRRGAALAIAGTVLALLGIAALASIGLPILAAGVLALTAAVRSRR